jgi:predicted nucleic acid-binding protein
MSGTDIFIDTNICIYLLDGDLVLTEMLQDQNVYVSIVTEIELYAYHGNSADSLKILSSFLESVSIININEGVKINTVEIRKSKKLKLPDCIIAASALSYGLPFLTADKAFSRVEAIDLILYEKV